jgi:hypothetical protein
LFINDLFAMVGATERRMIMTSFASFGGVQGPIAGRKEALGLAVGSGFNEAARERYSGQLGESTITKGIHLHLW